MSPISVKDRKSNTRREKHERLLFIRQRRKLWRAGTVEVTINPVDFLVRKEVCAYAVFVCLHFVHNCVYMFVERICSSELSLKDAMLL